MRFYATSEWRTDTTPLDALAHALEAMNTLKSRLALFATAIFALASTPAAAAGIEEAVVPPSNSAATQYTETFPTSGGDKKTDKDPNQRSPSHVLGSSNAHKLEEQGPEGQAAAEAAAATAPSAVETEPATTPPAHGAGNGSGTETGTGAGHQGDGTAAVGPATAVERSAPPPAAQPAGSSGAGSAIEQATGLSTSGQSGALLPLVIVATVLCSIAYLWRQRRQA
jgi:cobalamin biosynthesis Mg chelatase CobN